MLNSDFSMYTKKPLIALPQKIQNSNFLIDETLKLFAEVNYLLTEAGKINEAIIVIGPPESGKSSVLKTLARNEHYEQFSSRYKSNIHLPQKFKIGNKVFWECSNKIKPKITEQDAIFQGLVNMFFIKNLMAISDKLKFIIVVQEKAVINPDDVGFTSIIEYFKTIFPNDERIKLQENVTCVITHFNKSNQTQFLKSLESKKDVLGYFPNLLTNLKYLHEFNTQNDAPILSLKLEDISNISSETKININRLSVFLNTQDVLGENPNLAHTLYKEIPSNIYEIYRIIKSIFTGENFDIYKSRDCSSFLGNNYKEYVQKFFSESQLNYQNLEKNLSYFQGLQELFDLKAALDGRDGDPLSAGLEILGVIKKFANNPQIKDYHYILDQQIKQLLFFQEPLSRDVWSNDYNHYTATIETCKSFIEKICFL